MFASPWAVKQRRLRSELEGQARDYSKCMLTLWTAKMKHGTNFPEVFRTSLRSSDIMTASEAIQLDSCRMLTKDFWRVAFKCLDYKVLTPPEIDDLKARHAKFTEVVKQLDDVLKSEGLEESDSRNLFKFP